jgi:hypothetical protein
MLTRSQIRCSTLEWNICTLDFARNTRAPDPGTRPSTATELAAAQTHGVAS